VDRLLQSVVSTVGRTSVSVDGTGEEQVWHRRESTWWSIGHHCRRVSAAATCRASLPSRINHRQRLRVSVSPVTVAAKGELTTGHFTFWISFYRATRTDSADYAVVRCPSVRLSVTRRYCVQTISHYMLKVFSPSGSTTILVFPYQTGWLYSERGRRMQGGMKKSRFSTSISLNLANEWPWVTSNTDVTVMISRNVK